MSEIKPSNYITIMGWMVSELGLKKIDLIVFACIYGFSQDEDSAYRGGIRYLCEWCGCSKNTILTALKNLESRELIIKTDVPITKTLKTCEYRINFDVVKNCTSGAKIEPNISSSLNYNNISNHNISNNISNNIYIDIINYLNNLLGANFKPGVQKTKSLIDARLKEGFTKEDFYSVIDHKVKEWGNDPKMKQYLRPITLFGTKFESYLNAIPNIAKNNGSIKEEPKSRFDGLDENIINQMREQGAISEDEGIDYSLLTEEQIKYLQENGV